MAQRTSTLVTGKQVVPAQFEGLSGKRWVWPTIFISE